MRQQWRLWLATVAAGVVAASLFASPALASGGRATSAARGSSLKVSIAVERFARTSRGRTIARGVAVARLNDYTRQSPTPQGPVTPSASSGGSCCGLHPPAAQLAVTPLGRHLKLK